MITATNTQSVGRYIGYLTQTGTSTPVLHPILNTIGTLQVTRLAAGNYIITSSTPLAENTLVNNSLDGSNPTVYSTTLPSLNAQLQAWKASTYTIIVYFVQSSDATKIDISTLGGGNLKVFINIESYNYITPTV